MERTLIKHLRFILPLVLLIGTPLTARAWTSAAPTRVDVRLEVAAEGPSTVRTEVRYVVEGGRFHGFDLAGLPGGNLVPEECRARLDDGRILALEFSRIRGDRTRLTLGGGESVRGGAVTFELVHRIDLIEQGALRRFGGRARLDWTPLVWDDGLLQMQVEVALPGESRDAPPIADPVVSEDYVVESSANAVTLLKHRTVRWYPMKVVIDFDPALVAQLEPESVPAAKEPSAPQPLAAVAAPRPGPPHHVLGTPLVAGLIGLLALLLKALHLRRVNRDLGLVARFRLMPGAPLALRFGLSVAALGLGLAAQWIGSVAAGILPLAALAALWLVRIPDGALRPRPGGQWSRLDEQEAARYRRLAAAYRRSRRSIVDVTTFGGAVAFLATLGVASWLALSMGERWPSAAWALVLDWLVLAVPAWFSGVLAEQPVDPLLEGFWELRRWRRSMAKLVGAHDPNARADFWVRADGRGPLEVRLRIDSPLNALKGIELAVEVLRSGSLYRVRPAAILHCEPGTEAARRLAACPHAVEHHLTPDLEQEVIVLRNRRGRHAAGLAPLRTALARLPG